MLPCYTKKRYAHLNVRFRRHPSGTYDKSECQVEVIERTWLVSTRGTEDQETSRLNSGWAPLLLRVEVTVAHHPPLRNCKKWKVRQPFMGTPHCTTLWSLLSTHNDRISDDAFSMQKAYWRAPSHSWGLTARRKREGKLCSGQKKKPELFISEPRGQNILCKYLCTATISFLGNQINKAKIASAQLRPTAFALNRIEAAGLQLLTSIRTLLVGF